MATGGDITEISFNHPTLGTGTFYPKSGEDSTFDPGGIRGADDTSSVAANGKIIRQLNRQRWSVEATLAWEDNVDDDLLKLSALSGDPEEAQWTITRINGSVYTGTGSPVGDNQGEGNKATIKIKLSGGGELKKIA